MTRIPYPELADVCDDARQVLEGGTLNIIRMTAHCSPGIWDGQSAMGRAMIGGSPLDLQLRETAILRVGYLSRCEYEIFHHESLARAAGLSDEAIGQIRDGRYEALSPAQRAVAVFTDDVVLNVRPSDENLAAVREHLSDRLLLDLLSIIGSYMSTARIIETTGLDFDGAPISNWKSDPRMERALSQS